MDKYSKTILNCFSYVLLAQETVEKLCSTYDLSEEFAVDAETHPAKHRNIATILGCLAEKLAGPKSIEIMKSNVLKYLLANLVSWWHQDLKFNENHRVDSRKDSCKFTCENQFFSLNHVYTFNLGSLFLQTETKLRPWTGAIFIKHTLHLSAKSHVSVSVTLN